MFLLFAAGTFVFILLMIGARVLLFLYWHRVRSVNPILFEAKSRSWRASFTDPIGKLQPFWSWRVLIEKSSLEREFGSLDDVVLNRLASATKGLLIAGFILWTVLFELEIVEKALAIVEKAFR